MGIVVVMVTETSDVTVETEITDVVIVIVDVTVVDISLSTPIKKVIQGFIIRNAIIKTVYH